MHFKINDNGQIVVGKILVGDRLFDAKDLGKVHYWVRPNVTRYNIRLWRTQAKWEDVPSFEAENLAHAMVKCQAKKLMEFVPAKSGTNLETFNGMIGRWMLKKIVKGEYNPAPNQKLVSI